MKHRRVLIFSLLIVALLVGGSGLWVRQAKHQYTLNRELIAALEHDDTPQALTFVNAGGDPNTHQTPSSPPDISELLQRLLRHQPLPDDNSPTAFLLACGAVIYKQEKDDWPLMQNGDLTQLVRIMLVHGADIHAKTDKKWTALHGAATRNLASVAQLLLEHGANVNAQSTSGKTPLMLAIWNEHPNIVRLLLKHGASVNVQNDQGDTGLHIAVNGLEDEETIKQLLAQGANPNLPDNDGDTPLSVAEKINRPDIVDLMRKGKK